MTESFVVHDVQRGGRAIGTVYRPRTVRDALEAHGQANEARFLAGGTDLLLDLQRGGSGSPVDLIDTTCIEDFQEIADLDDYFRLGGGVRHGQIVQDERLVDSVLPLAQACLEVGSPQLRNRATIAGNLATASPANDTLSALIALSASVEMSRLDGGVVHSREIKVEDFFTGFRQTALETGELITAIRVPKLQPSQRGLWVKLGLRRAQAISVVHAGLVVTFDSASPVAERVVLDARLALGSVAATVVVVGEFADVLRGARLSDAKIAEAAGAAAGAVNPISDGRATADYRVDGIEVAVRRSLHAIAAGKQGAMWPENPPTLSTAAQLAAPARPARPKVKTSTEITVEVNGATCSGPAGSLTLLDWVRDEARLTGMKEGCAEGECGACTMTLDGAAVMSCLVTAAQADGSAVTTVDGLDHPIQQAFVDEFAVQCGFCIPGFLMAGSCLLDENTSPTNEQIEHGLSGNLCRCTGYYPIVEAVHAAAVEIRGSND